MTASEIKPGDDITISGTVTDETPYEDEIVVETRNGNVYYIKIEDVKTIRPKGNGGKGRSAGMFRVHEVGYNWIHK